MQLVSYGYGFENEVNEAGQDSTIITADQGNYSAPRGIEAKTCRSRDGSRVKKGNQWYFGFKLHQAMDLIHQLIRFFEVTTASVHDSQIIFSMKEKILYRDKGFVGVKSNSYPAMMLRQAPDPLTNEYRKQRNKRISSKRAPVERPFATLKHMHSDHVRTTTIARTKVRMLIACIIFNIKQVITLQNQEKTKKKQTQKIKEHQAINYELNHDCSLLTDLAEKLVIKYIKKRHKTSRKNRKLRPKKHKQTTKNKKIEKDEQPNFQKLTVKKLNYSFYITK